MEPAGCGGKPGRGNGNHRHGGGGEGSARWLHAALHRRPANHHGARAAYAALRSTARPGSGRCARQKRPAAGCASLDGNSFARRSNRSRKGQTGRAHFRFGGQGITLSPMRRNAQAAGGYRDDPRPLGKYGEAEGLYKRALTILEKALGANHPDVAWTLNDLALVYRGQGKYGEAEALFKRALTIREKALGASHAHVGQTLNNLANVYRDQGKYDEA